MDPCKPTPSLNELLNMGNNVKVYHLPSYARYDLRHNQDGSRTFNPLSLSSLCANLAVANANPRDVQRFVGQNRPQFRASTIEDPNQVKDLVDRLEKYQTPGSEDSIPFVRMELARYKYREQHPVQEGPSVTAFADDLQVTQPKRMRLDSSLPVQHNAPVPPPLVSALEEAYSDLYLTKPGSLRASYETGTSPPRKDSIVKLAGALAQLPACDQLKRVDSIRKHGVNLISLVEVDEDFVLNETVISLQD